MYPVSQEFLEAVSAPERQVRGRVAIDYTSPFLDQSIEVAVSEQANVSYPAQTADSVMDATYKWLSLDGSCLLDGTYHPMPLPGQESLYQVGWWGQQLAGEGGAFPEPHPTLTVTHFPRPVHRLRVVGDSARGEYPVDFTVDLYGEGDVLLHSESVTGNTEVNWLYVLPSPVLDVARQVLTVTRWSHTGRQVKIAEFFTSVRQIYESADLVEISLLEEREIGTGTIPVGAISANEITIRLRNDDRRFDADNDQSPLYRLLKPNRRLRAWLGVRLSDESIEWVPLGVYWSTEWQAPGDAVVASVIARDRMELLRKSTYQSSHVQQGVSLYDLAEAVLQDAGLASEEYDIDPALQNIIVPWAWFEPVSHREALRLIAEAAMATVYGDRDGIVRIVPFLAGGTEPELTIGPDQYFRADNPMRPGEVANEVIVETQPLRPVDTAQEVYRSNEPVTVGAGQAVQLSIHYNERPVLEATASLEGATNTVIQSATYYGWGAQIVLHNPGAQDENVTLVISGKPLKVLNRERAVAQDPDSITELSVLRWEAPANPLVQTRAVAQQLADLVLASVKDPRRDLELDWRGNPALELGDRIASKGGEYHVIRNELDWAGGLRARTTGRRAT